MPPSVIAAGDWRADRRRRGGRPALPRHRELRLRLRREPDRERGAARARQPRLRVRGASSARRLEAGALRRSTSTASASSFAATRWWSPTTRRTGAGCTPRPERSSTTACSMSSGASERLEATVPVHGAAARSSRGRTCEPDEVHVRRAREVEISADRPFTVYADGDPLADLPTTVTLLPRALRVLAPPHDIAESSRVRSARWIRRSRPRPVRLNLICMR